MYLVRIALVFTGTIHNHIDVTSLQVKNKDVVISPVLEIVQASCIAIMCFIYILH